jgi:hypothetical protein
MLVQMVVLLNDQLLPLIHLSNKLVDVLVKYCPLVNKTNAQIKQQHNLVSIFQNYNKYKYI